MQLFTHVYQLKLIPPTGKELIKNDYWYACFIPKCENGIVTDGHLHKIKIVSSYNVIFISFLSNSRGRGIYLFSKKGELLNKHPYSSLIKISDRNNMYPDEKLFFYGYGKGVVVIGRNGSIREIQYVGKILNDWQSVLYRYSKPVFSTTDISNFDVSDIAIFVPLEEASSSYEDFYIKGNYYDIFLNPLEKVVIDEELEIESVIDKYLYKTANGFYWNLKEEYRALNKKKRAAI